MKLLSGLCRKSHAAALQGTCGSISQTLLLENGVIGHVAKHRQMRVAAWEAGGQLFGLVSEDEVRVVVATGPYRGDERGRYHYRSDPVSAQLAIKRQAKAGMFYLGEWHTHFEDDPSASSSDMDTMGRLLANSRLNVNSLLLLIVSRSSGVNGVALYSVSATGVDQWAMC